MDNRTEDSENTFQPSVELLIDYVEGLISPETNAKIEAHLATSEEDAAVVDGIRWFLAENGSNRDELFAFLGHSEQKQLEKVKNAPTAATPVVPMPAPQPARSAWWRIAAALIVVIGAGISLWTVMATSSTEALVAEAVDDRFRAPDVWRGNDRVMAEAAALYQQGDFPAFCDVVTAYLDTATTPDPAAPFYLGLGQLYDGNNTVAAATLQTVADNPDNRYQQTAAWFRSLALYEAGNVTEAAVIWQEIAANLAHPYQSRATELLASTE